MSKSRVQLYMEKHRLTPLFEDLMNKVLNEQPEDPIVYMIKCLYRKASLPVPKDLKTSLLRKSSPERVARRSKSPEKPSTQAWAIGSGPDLVDRSYEKPWLSNSRKGKYKDEERSEPKTKQAPTRKQKTGWVSDTKVTTTTFDDLFDEDSGKPDVQTQQHRADRREGTDISRAWARNVSLKGGEDANYRSRGYSGPRCHRNEDDPLAGEIMLAREESKQETLTSTGRSKGAKLEARQHRQDLEKLLRDLDQASTDSGFDAGRVDDVEDDAMELLEDPEDLMREGVTNIPKSSYKLGRNLRQRRDETNVKLNINLITTGSRNSGSAFGFKNPDEYYESDFERPETGMSYQSNRFSQFSPDVSDDEFESISQVVGPRLPVWSVPDSDGEIRQDPTWKHSRNARFSATVAARPDGGGKPSNVFLDGSKTWAPGDTSNREHVSINRASDKDFTQRVRGMSPVTVRDSMTVRDSVQSVRSHEGGGWNIPDDTEVSLATDWSEATSARNPRSGGPKAY